MNAVAASEARWCLTQHRAHLTSGDVARMDDARWWLQRAIRIRRNLAQLTVAR